KQWLARLDRDHANIRAALDWLEASGETQLALRLTGAAARFWEMRGYPAEGRRRLESALSADDAETLARSKALYNLSLLAFELGDKTRAADLHEQNLRQAREVANPRIEAVSLTALADRKVLPGELQEALSMLHDAYLIVREVGDRVEAADILSRFASILASTG